MSIKANKLSQTIENIQIFLDKRSHKQEDMADILSHLSQLNKTLSHKQLKIQIVSQTPALAKAAFELINTQQELTPFFQVKFGCIPETPEQLKSKQYAILKLGQHLENSASRSQFMKLDSNREYSIGRAPESDLTFDGKLFQGVSWSHAVILPLIEEGQETQWQICDRHSTNGTFVNGERIKDSQILKSGDVITLVSPQTGTKNIAEFVFNLQVETLSTEAIKKYDDVVDCDLLMVVVDSKQQLTSKVKDFMQYLDRTYISQQFLLVNTPNSQIEPTIMQDAEENLGLIANWVKSNIPEPDFEVFPLNLKPFDLENLQEEVNPKQLKKQENFIKLLSNIIKRQPENILAKRIAAKVVRILEPAEHLLFQQQRELAEKIAQKQGELESLSQINLKEASKKAIAEANQNKEYFFKQIKQDLSQSKAAFLDAYSKKSIIYKIQNFVDGFNPVILSKNGKKIVQLNDESRPDRDDINISLIDFCTNLLQKWATAECYRVSNVYGNGGLHGLVDRLKEQINIIPNPLSESPFSNIEDINVEDNFLVSFAGANCETTYKHKSLGTYIVKQLRSQMMQILISLTLVLSFLGITLSKNDIIQSLSSYFKQYPWLFGLFIAGIIFLLVSSYNSETNLKLEEAEEKLKKDLSSYYQSFSKNLLNNVVQDITWNLELENKKISDGLKVVNQAYSDRLEEIERQKITIKQNLEQYQAQQKSLNTELSEFAKLKQI